ncbi:MAG: tryptophan synthase subunit alpha [Ilumatobacteraceae bacterium]
MTRVDLEGALRSARSNGRKLLVPYLTGGLGDWSRAVEAAVAAGADAIEVGIQFSDPAMDGPVIQESSQRALDAGATPTGILDELARIDVDVPLVVMCYYNTIHHAGLARFAASLARAGVSGAIVPDLPLEESGPWAAAADAENVATVMLASPITPDDRLPLICDRARGFVYSVGLLGVTGERDTLASTATVLAGRLKRTTELPVLIGVGVSNPEQAVEACSVADGVEMGAAEVRRFLEGGPDAVADFVGATRRALDSM